MQFADVAKMNNSNKESHCGFCCHYNNHNKKKNNL